jgi:Flp pilus assembly protein TadG
MPTSPPLPPRQRRRAAAAVELALVLPLLVFLFVLTVDYARLFYYTQTLDNCARNGALYACDAYAATQSPYASVNDAALADAPDSFRSQLTVTSSTATTSAGQEVVVTVGYTFTTMTQYPGVPTQMNLTRTVRMRVVPASPN